MLKNNRYQKKKSEVSYIPLICPGRFDLNDAVPIWNTCNEKLEMETPHDIIREQCWPGSVGRKLQYIFDQDLFLFYDLLQKNIPGVSGSGFLKTLEHFSEAKGRVCLYF